MASNKKPVMTVFTLTMMTVAAVISLRGLPMMAAEGLSMIFYILFATVLFLLPASLVSAELGGAFSQESGGVYTWVKSAFSSRWGFLAIWLQWVQNVIWYPTVLGFAAASLAYLFLKPELANNGVYTGITIIVVYWVATIIAFTGSRLVGAVTKYGVILGTIIPGLLIITLGIVWVLKGNDIEFLKSTSEHVKFHPHFFPHISGLSSLAFLAGIILLFAGVEVQGVRASELPNPSKQYPQAIFYAMLIILVLFLLGSLSVAVVIPANEISLTAGLMEAFKTMLDRFDMGGIVPILGFLTAFGAIGGVMSWISGPSKGLLSTAQEGELPPFLAKTNKNGVQINILIVQGVIVTVLAGLYFIMDNVSVAFFLLSAMTVTLYLIMYMFMYVAAIKLRYTKPDMVRSYKVPGGIVGMWIISGIGFLGVAFAFVVAFFPPSNLPIGNPALYVGLVVAGSVIFIAIPLLISKFKKSSWLVTKNDK